MSNESENKRIDMTQFEGATEGPWYAEEEEVEEGKAWTVRGGDHWVVMESDGCLRIDWKKEDALLTAAAPDLIAELERCYYLIAKMQESIVKTLGECWVCGDYIDSCDSNTCERQILEDIELGTASE